MLGMSKKETVNLIENIEQQTPLIFTSKIYIQTNINKVCNAKNCFELNQCEPILVTYQNKKRLW